MICENCLTENPDGVKFCKECGARLDGLKVCPKCKAEVPVGANFCSFCGTDLRESAEERAAKNGHRICPSCKAEVSAESKFCTVCGANLQEYLVEQETEKERSVIDYIHVILSVLAALSVLVFVFFVGFTSSMIVVDSGEREVAEETLSIYDFFGKQFRDFSETLKASNSYSAFYEVTNNVSYVFNTVITVAGLCGVVVLSVIAFVQSIRYTLGDAHKSAFPYAIGAVVCYIGMASALKLISGMTSVAEYDDYYVEMSIKLNGATVAGIIISAILAAASAVTKCVADGRKTQATAKGVLGAIFACVSAVAFAAVAFITFNPALPLKSIVSTSSEINISFTPMSFATYIADIAGTKYDIASKMKNTDAVMIYSALSAVCCIAVITIAGILLIKKLNGSKWIGEIVLASCLVAATVLCLAFTICAANNGRICLENIGTSEGDSIEFVYTTQIAMLVVSALALGSVITERFIMKQN